MRQTFLVLAGIAIVAMSTTDAQAQRRSRRGGCGVSNQCGGGCGYARPVRQARPARYQGFGNGCNNSCGNVCSTPSYAAPVSYASYTPAPVYSAPMNTGCSSCGVAAAPVSYSQPMVSSGCSSCGVAAAPVSYSQPMVSSGCSSCGGGCGTVASAPMMNYATPVSYNTGCNNGCGVSAPMTYTSGCGTMTSAPMMNGTVINGGCGTAGGCGTIIQGETVAPTTTAPATIEDAPAPPADGGVEDAPAPPAEEDKAA